MHKEKLYFIETCKTLKMFTQNIFKKIIIILLPETKAAADKTDPTRKALHILRLSQWKIFCIFDMSEWQENKKNKSGCHRSQEDLSSEHHKCIHQMWWRCSQQLFQHVSKMPNRLMEQHKKSTRITSQWCSAIKQLNGSLTESCCFLRTIFLFPLSCSFVALLFLLATDTL